MIRKKFFYSELLELLAYFQMKININVNVNESDPRSNVH